jgi:hypothetical protein
VAVDAAALPGVGPVDLRVQDREDRIDVARVERVVRAADERLVVVGGG